MSEPAPARVLIVDDDEGKRYAISRTLRAAGFAVDEAPTGARGLELVRADHDVVILDIKLPDIDGWEVCRRIKARPETRGVMVLELSARYVESGDRVRGLDDGADAYLVHPIEARELVAGVRALVRIRVAERERDVQRGLVLATVSHDLRSPLHVISMCTDILKASATLAPNDRVYVERIHKTMQRMSRMVEQQLAFSRGISSERPLTRQPVHLGELCASVVGERELQDREIRVDDQLGVVVEVDPVQLGQLVDNLIGNAIEHGIGPVTIALARAGEHACISVHNHGKPIPQEALSTLFEPFRRGTSVGKGLGLGLFIVSQIAHAHGGTVSVSSTSDRGTTISVALPLTHEP